MYTEIFPDDLIIQRLIHDDMLIHTIKESEINNFINHPYAIDLIFAGISAMNANALLFGGIYSVNFKIKAKKLEQRLKKIIPLLIERSKK